MAEELLSWPVLALAAATVLAVIELHRRQLRRRTFVVESAVDDDRFANVVGAFKRNFAEGREAGAQLVCYYRGSKVVDCCGGRSAPEQLFRNSLVVLFSCTKVVESLVVAQLVDKGVLAYEDTVAKHWPEFGETVGAGVTIADLMKHQGGVSALRSDLSLEEGVEVLRDPKRAGELLSQNEPEWRPTQPPTRQVYHAVTRGLYVAELLRRVDGRSIAAYVQEEIVDRINAARGDGEEPIELTIGCRPEDQHRVAHHKSLTSPFYTIGRMVLHFVLPRFVLRHLFDPEMDLLHPFELDITKAIFTNPAFRRAFGLFAGGPRSGAGMANSPLLRSLPLASAMGIGNAAALAAIGKELATRPELLLPGGGIKAALEPCPPILRDEILCRELSMSPCGWGLDRFDAFGCEGWVGWAGMGGSVFVFDPRTQSSFAYVITGFATQQFKARGMRLLRAFTAAIAQDSKAR